MKQPSSSCHNFCQIIKLDSQCSLQQANDAESTQIQSVPHRAAMDGVMNKNETNAQYPMRTMTRERATVKFNTVVYKKYRCAKLHIFKIDWLSSRLVSLKEALNNQSTIRSQLDIFDLTLCPKKKQPHRNTVIDETQWPKYVRLYVIILQIRG